MMTGSEIRRKFLEYFENHEHKVVHSSPVYPPNDPTILFTNAGMNQFKDVFLGNERREYKRAVSSQKCIRAGGKHNDLDEVGKTARHHTFFEMLGNFSFGDYFKEEAIKFAWDFLTGSKDEGKLGLDPAHLWFTYFEGNDEVPVDAEARDLWIKAGAKPERVLPFDAKDNFWQMGDTGPCGPCSEIHYYMGDDAENPEKNRAEFVNAETGDDTIEIWNLVFMQFNRIGEGAPQADGKYASYRLENLPAPSVDTGAGLERIAAVMQGVKTNYDTDLIKPIIVDCIAKLADRHYEYDTPEGFAMRVVADHARTTAFSIADGILPGNEGRAYVLRKIMRRAIYHGREHLGFHDAFFYKVCDFVVDQMRDAFPELDVQREFISKMVRLEEERFGNTMTVGLKNFIEDYEESQSPIMKVSEIVRRELDNPNYSSEITQIKIRKYMEEREEKYGQKDSFEILANLSYEYKIPPYLVFTFLESKDEMEIRMGESVFYRQFGGAICGIIAEKGTPEEKSLLQNTEQKYSSPREIVFAFMPLLDAYFDGLEDLKLPNFKDFARNYDTFGTPRDLIRLALEERNISIGEEEFNNSFDVALQEIQKQSTVGKTERKSVINPFYHEIAKNFGSNQFHGYETTQVEEAEVLALFKDEQLIVELKEGEEGLIVLSDTPFYAEAGGQVGDTGFLTNETSKIKVQDTFAPVKDLILHKSKVEKGSVKVGDALTATVDADKRDATRRNHTATHLVHAALREVLGTHVKQAGSVVAPQFLRFDYTHYQPLSEQEIREVEDLVNREILKNDAVNTDLKSIEEAMESGAMALFGEKYGSQVRVLSIGEGTFSKELCGGTHVRATGDIGSFKIVSDESIASGVRRIRAITGFDAFQRFREDERLIEQSLGFLKTQRDQLPNAIERLQDELKRMRRENDELKMKIATGAAGNGSSNGDEARDVSGVKVIAKSVEGLDKGGMRQLSDTLLARLKSGVVVLARTEDDKVSFIVRVSDDLTDQIKAGKIVQEIAPIVGGRGGGKPDMAEGGGTDASKLSDALEASYKVVEQMLGN